jgi:hypothetical protein
MENFPSVTDVVPSFFGTSGFFSDTIDAGSIVAVVFALIFLWWLIYSLVAAYHWLRFGRETWVAVPALGVYLVVSGWLLFFMTSGLH